MSRDIVSSEQNKASIEWEAYDEWERWKEIEKNLSKAYKKANEEGRFEQFKERKLEIIDWGRTAEEVSSQEESIIRDVLDSLYLKNLISDIRIRQKTCVLKFEH